MSPVRRTLLLALLAFLLGFLAVSVGVGQSRFLWSAYHHGGL
jgi:hypothetical protein